MHQSTPAARCPPFFVRELEFACIPSVILCVLCGSRFGPYKIALRRT